jgi:hypothetical protein
MILLKKRQDGQKIFWLRSKVGTSIKSVGQQKDDSNRSSISSPFSSFESFIHDPSELGVHPGVSSVGMERMSEISLETETQPVMNVGSFVAAQSAMRVASLGTQLAAGNDVIDEDLAANAYMLANKGTPFVTPQPVAPVPVHP